MEETVPVTEEVPTVEVRKPQRHFLFVFLLLIIFVGVFFYKKPSGGFFGFINLDRIINPGKQDEVSDISSIRKFSSEQEFKTYMEASSQQLSGMFGIGQREMVEVNAPVAVDSVGQSAKELSVSSSEVAPDRYSDTNVQVQGVDEPDVIKTDGKDIFISNNTPFYGLEIAPRVSSATASSPSKYSDMPNMSNTRIVTAFPIDSMEKQSEIENSGNLLLSDNILSVFSGDAITSYDVSIKTAPREIWKYEFDERSSLISSRLVDGKIYLAFRLTNYGNSCDLPVTIGTSQVKISCMDIYRPDMLIPADSVFIVLKIDSKTGVVEDKNSFVGSSGLSVFYMSQNNMYLTYTYYDDLISLFYNFYETDGKGLLPAEIMNKLKNLKNLDLSVQSKLTELSIILEKHKQTLSSDDLLLIETETQNKLSEYLKKNVRSFEHSGIVKIDLQNLNIIALGNIPGKPLNQFSLDEYEGNLRIATSVGDGMFSDYGVNDVYVFDSSLKELGKVTDMGVTEKIYSVRFIEDKGYVVTFKNIDPFYVLDLKDPKNPKKTGELKIPGYSSYLHMLEKDLILGVGMEGSKVKLSLFDVSNASDPKEVSKYMLDEYWSEVSSNHHAFLQDSMHKIFFVPGGKGGYIVGYEGGTLSLEKAVGEPGVKRALYLNNYLYLVGNSKITVLDELSWGIIKSFTY